MTKKNLAQELREIANAQGGGMPVCEKLLQLTKGERCRDEVSCFLCSKKVLNALVDRIEAEYDPKPEPDTVEKVAKDMWLYLEYLYAGKLAPFKVPVQTFSERLEDLGVSFDD